MRCSRRGSGSVREKTRSHLPVDGESNDACAEERKALPAGQGPAGCSVWLWVRGGSPDCE